MRPQVRHHQTTVRRQFAGQAREEGARRSPAMHGQYDRAFTRIVIGHRRSVPQDNLSRAGRVALRLIRADIQHVALPEWPFSTVVWHIALDAIL